MTRVENESILATKEVFIVNVAVLSYTTKHNSDFNSFTQVT